MLYNLCVIRVIYACVDKNSKEIVVLIKDFFAKKKVPYFS